MQLNIEQNPINFHRVHAVSKSELFVNHQFSSIHLPPMDSETIFLNRPFLYSKDMFVSFQQYTNHVYKIHEIYSNRIRTISFKKSHTHV